MPSPGLEEALTDPRTEEMFRRMRERPAHLGCPWCGDVPISADFSHGSYSVRCENEHCPAEPMVVARTLAEAFAKWDRRAIQPMHDPDMNISNPGALR